MGEERTRVSLGSWMCKAESLGMGKALSSSSVESSSDIEELTAVGEEGVIEGGGEDNLAESGGGIGRARGESQGRGMEA